mgnify:CR=1 FL=1
MTKPKRIAQRPQIPFAKWLRSAQFRALFPAGGPSAPTLRSMIDNGQIDGYFIERGPTGKRAYFVFLDQKPQAAANDEISRLLA